MLLISKSNYEIHQLTDNIQIDLLLNSGKKSKSIPISKTRDYLFASYNWNAIVKILHHIYKVYQSSFDISDQISGTTHDDNLILPDKVIAWIIDQQVLVALKKHQITNSNANKIFKMVDGLPGKGFCKQVLKTEYLDFLNEKNNTSQKDPVSGEKLVIPSSEADESTFYDFFEKITFTRNGIWSTKPGVVNITGMRRVLVKNRNLDAGYNDTIACSWLDKNGIKHCELNIATTEPGNRIKARQLFPQTMTMLPGYHNIRQPAGRTRNALKEGSNIGINRRKNDLKQQWCSGDTTMNFHQGGNSFRYPYFPNRTPRNQKIQRNIWLTYFNIDANMKTGTPSSKADQEALFQLNLVLSELYYLLSKYGGKGDLAPYKNLKNLAEAKAIKRSEIKNGKITVSQNGGGQKVIDVAHVKNRTVRIWFDGRRNETTKKKIYEILKHISDYSPEQILSWRNHSMQQVIDLIKDEHILNIVDIQIEHLQKISQGIDGIAGNQFYKMIKKILPNKSEALVDKKRVDDLLSKIDNLPVKNTIKNVFKTSMTINTELNRTNVLEKTKHIVAKDLDIVDGVNVGGYSAGCQVFYDTEVFYNFWTKLLKRGEQSGQRRWYYTLIDITNFKKSEVL